MGKAVVEVQACRMAAPAEGPMGRARKLAVTVPVGPSSFGAAGSAAGRQAPSDLIGGCRPRATEEPHAWLAGTSRSVPAASQASQHALASARTRPI